MLANKPTSKVTGSKPASLVTCYLYNQIIHPRTLNTSPYRKTVRIPRKTKNDPEGRLSQGSSGWTFSETPRVDFLTSPQGLSQEPLGSTFSAMLRVDFVRSPQGRFCEEQSGSTFSAILRVDFVRSNEGRLSQQCSGSTL
ncbi:hypothetical protein PoB_000595000 [Plakobranchus ocellatus]|uniref:Uncharacterized protein n=1 Tax=Plakobranchus ocellatus TaxID=259542 RepID=A0AAV3Y8K1_9GAST|nr:hypothetical protein PoB_000595000 [Plakobranchus ocellatus]